MGGFIGFVILAGIFGLIIFLAYKHKKKVLEEWRKTAHELGLHFNDGGFMLPSSILGTLDGLSISVRTETRGSGKNSKTVTVYRVKYAQRIPFKFKLTRQNFLHSFGKMFGMQDIEVGDKSFDDSVIVQSADTAKIRDFLTAPRRKHVKTALRTFPNITISNYEIQVERNGMESSGEMLKKTIWTLCAIAQVIGPERDADHPLEKAKKAREEGDMAKAMEIITVAEGLNEDEALEAKEMEGHIHIVANDAEKAAAAFAAVNKDMDDDEDSERWRQLAEARAETSTTTPPPLPDTTAPSIDTVATENVAAPEEMKSEETTVSVEDAKTPAASSISVNDFCSTVFADNLGSFDSAKIFDADFKGKKIFWSGKLISVAPFSFDFVFKDGGGVKATYEIFDLKSSYSTTKVKAIVRFPEEKLEELKNQVGTDDQKFTGELVSLDGLTKNVFIAQNEDKA